MTSFGKDSTKFLKEKNKSKNIKRRTKQNQELSRSHKLANTSNHKLEQRAKKLIQNSHKGNINLKDFSSKEKAKAIEMARRNPRANFIRKSIYYSILSDTSSSPKIENNKKIKRKITPKQKRRRTHEANKQIKRTNGRD